MSVNSFLEKINVKSPNSNIVSEKPSIPGKNKTKRVDINILKSKLEAQESKEFKKNLSIFSLCALLLGALGVYLSL